MFSLAHAVKTQSQVVTLNSYQEKPFVSQQKSKGKEDSNKNQTQMPEDQKLELTKVTLAFKSDVEDSVPVCPTLLALYDPDRNQFPEYFR